MAKILVTGGCGYIGSHTIIDLLNHGFEVICIDNNVHSSAAILERVQHITGQQVPHYTVDLCDLKATQAVFEAHPDIQGIIHFAAYKSVPKSVTNPLSYYHNNINSLLNVLNCIQQYQIASFVFSSSCSVYGNTNALPVKETTPMGRAESPYASTKQMCERIIQDFSVAQPHTQSMLLRYFNPAGAHPSGLIGEIPQAGSYNVVALLLETAVGKRSSFSVTGTDHPTRDGSCIRDYIHVMDVANAHTKALQYLLDTNRVITQAPEDLPNCTIFNIGIGEGTSVLELIQAFEDATGQVVPHHIGPRRAGDVSAIYANYDKAAEFLHWVPQYTVKDILATAWRWFQAAYLSTKS